MFVDGAVSYCYTKGVNGESSAFQRGAAGAGLALVAVVLFVLAGRAFTELTPLDYERSALLLPLVALAVFVSLAAVGITRSSLTAQVLSRGVAWLILASAAWPLFRGARWDSLVGLMEVGCAVGLIASFPSLESEAARRAFAPVAFRRVFLAAAVASATAATHLVLASHIALDRPLVGVFLVLGMGYAAAAVGVVRMRAWGVLMGMAVAAITTLLALILGFIEPTALTAASVDPGWPSWFVIGMLALPGLLLVLPIAQSRWRRSEMAPKAASS